MKKKGVFEMSFSMIFSIILIVSFIALTSYVIVKVISTKGCAETGLFFQDLQNYIKEAWQADIHEDTFTGAGLPTSVKYVCFGNFSQTPSSEDRERYNTLKRYNQGTKNVFLYPPESICDNNQFSITLEHIKTNNFFCSQVEKGKIQIQTLKSKLGQPVLITK